MMRVEISPTGKFEINLGDGITHVLPPHKAKMLAKWIFELLPQANESQDDFLEWLQSEVAEDVLDEAGFWSDDAA